MKYLKTAFLNHWNLLAVFTGVAIGLLSAPDVVLPLVAAADIVYVVLLGSHPKFQQYVDAQEASQREGAPARSSRRSSTS